MHVVWGEQGDPRLMFGTGLVAGAASYWVSCPFFQAKTRLQACDGQMPLDAIR